MSFMTTTGATRYIRHGHACLGVTGPTGLTLTAGGHNDSLLWSRNPASGAGQLHTWSPWGSGKAADGLPGFNGERQDPVSGTYHLGNGYRAYNPVLRRFNCPDNLSPFGAGGINPYAYCAGDPVNHTDPTGHISWQGILGIVGGAIGVLLTGGAALGAIAAAGSVAAAWSSASATALVVGGLGIAADVTGIASGATEDVNPEASSVLGWVSMATGIAGMAAGAAMALKGGRALRQAITESRPQVQLDASSISGGRNILDLPNEILDNIANRLSESDLRHMGETHFKFRAIADRLMPAKIHESRINSHKIFDAIMRTPLTDGQAQFLAEERNNIGRFFDSMSEEGIIVAENRFQLKNYLRSNKRSYETDIFKWDVKRRYHRIYGRNANKQINAENTFFQARTWWNLG